MARMKSMKLKVGKFVVANDEGVQVAVPWLESIIFCSPRMSELWGDKIKVDIFVDFKANVVVAKPYICTDEYDRDEPSVRVVYSAVPEIDPVQVYFSVSPFTGVRVETIAPDASEFSDPESFSCRRTVAELGAHAAETATKMRGQDEHEEDEELELDVEEDEDDADEEEDEEGVDEGDEAEVEDEEEEDDEEEDDEEFEFIDEEDFDESKHEVVETKKRRK